MGGKATPWLCQQGWVAPGWHRGGTEGSPGLTEHSAGHRVTPGGVPPSPRQGDTGRGRATPSPPARPCNGREVREGTSEIVSLPRLPRAGDADSQQCRHESVGRKKTLLFPFSSAVSLPPRASPRAPEPPLGQGSSSRDRDGVGLFLFPGEMGISRKCEHLFSPGLYQHQHPPHRSCSFQTHLPVFDGNSSPPWALSAPSSSSALPSALLNLTSHCSCGFLLQSPG